MTNYSNKVRPVKNQDHTVQVIASFHLADINDVEVVQQRLVTTAYLSILWFDELLVWDKQITNIERLYFKQKDIWTPDIVLKNGVKKLEELGGEFYYLEVSPEGIVHWLPYQVFESKCDIDITYFPFDTQVCDITFISWSFTKLEVNMTLPESGPSVDFYDFNENSVWGIESTGGRRSQSDNADSTVTRLHHRCEERKVGTFYRGIVRIERCLRCVKSFSISDDIFLKKKYDWGNDSCEPMVDYDDVGWKDVSSAIDFVCFWTMLFFGIIATTVLVVYMNIGI